MRLLWGLTFLVYIILIPSICRTQSYYREFNNKDYDGSNSNFNITQDIYGHVYSSNYSGILKYSGSEWINLSSPSAYTSLLFSEKYQCIFYGSKNDFGYLTITESGVLEKQSLFKRHDDSYDEFIIWNIIEDNNCLYFSSADVDFVISDSDITRFVSDISHYQTNSSAYAYVDSLNTLYELQCSANYRVTPIQYRPQAMTGTQDSLIIVYENRAILLNSQYNSIDTISKSFNGIRSLQLLKDSKIAFGSHTGLVIYDLENRNEVHALPDEAIKDIYEDRFSNLWLAMQNGIGLYQYYSPVSQIINAQKTGTIFTLKSMDKNITVGSEKGLFHIDSTGHVNVSINHTVRALDVNRVLAVGSDDGVYLDNEKLIASKNTSLVHHLNHDSLLIGNTSGLWIYDIDNNNMLDSVIFDSNTFYNYPVIYHNSYWIGSKFNGLVSWRPGQKTIKNHRQDEGLINLAYNIPVVHDGKLYCFSTDGLYQYSDKKQLFTRLHAFKASLEHLEQINEDEYVASFKDSFGDRTLSIIRLTSDGIYTVTTALNTIISSDISAVTVGKNGNIYFATSEGVYEYNIKQAKKYNHLTPYNTLVSQVTSKDSLIFGGYYATYEGKFPRMVLDQPKSFIPTLDYAHNALKFQFSAPFYTQNEKIKFKYYLEGNEKSWSEWTKVRSKEYTNLSPGKYTFHVTSENVFGVQGRTASYTFIIAPPWYMTTWAYALFTIIAAIAIWLVALGYTYRVRQHRKKLKLLVADRTFEVLSQKKEIETQNELLKEQNEEIKQQRDAIDEKNQELQMSQEEVSSINDKLQELNTQLERNVEARTQELRTTVKKLRSTIYELDTFVYRASHDLKGPISRIHGLTSLAKLESTSPNDKKYYELIDAVAKDMNKMLAKLTQVHEVINASVTIAVVDLPVLIAKIRESNLFLDSSDETKYIFDLKSLLQIKTDPYLFEIALSNILENALIFKKPKQENHEIKITSAETDNEYIITIEDNGIGIAEEHLHMVFDMFFRASDQSKGNGLGLYLSKMAMEKLEGMVVIESEYGVYSRFTLRLVK